MNKAIKYFLFALLTVVGTQVQATVISYDRTDLGGGSWQYDYTVDNDSLGHSIFELTIYFEVGLYSNLVAHSEPDGWDPLVIQPGSFDGLNDGFYDALSFTGIDAGSSAGLFSVRFDWEGSVDNLAGQRFEIIDPEDFVEPRDFSVLDEGITVASSVVPVPAAAWLFGSGLIGLIGYARRR